MTSRLLGLAPRSTTALWCLCASMILSPHADARNAMIVVTSDSKPHKAASLSSSKALKDAGVDAEILSPEDALQAIESGKEIQSIVAIGPKAASAMAKELPPNIFLSYCLVPDPEHLGITTRPNSSGTSAFVSVNDQARVVVDLLPSIRRVGVLYRSGSPTSVKFIETIKAESPSEWTIVTVDLDAHDSVAEGVGELVDRDLDLIWTIPDPEVYNASTVRTLLLESLKHSTPVLGFSIPLTRAGALVGTSIDPAREGEQAARFATDKTDGVHAPPTPIYAVNQIVADKIGLDLNASVVADASQIFD